MAAAIYRIRKRKVVGRTDVQMQGNRAVAPVYGQIVFRKCATAGFFGQLESESVISIPLTNCVVESLIICRIDGQGQGTDGVASPPGLKGVADDGIGRDGRERESVVIIMAAATYCIREKKFLWLVNI